MEVFKYPLPRGEGMVKGFACLHSGNCCERPYTQISITIGDVLRLSTGLGKEVGALFKEGYVGISPFFETDEIFSCGLGLKIPCRCRIGQRCSAYAARPLNCRLFPYWLLSEIPKDRLSEYVDESYECIHSAELDGAALNRYKEYTGKISDILDEESALTETCIKELLIKQGLPEKRNLSDKSNRESKGHERKQDAKRLKEQENKRVALAEKIIREKGYDKICPQLCERISIISKSTRFATSQELEAFEIERETGL